MPSVSRMAEKEGESLTMQEAIKQRLIRLLDKPIGIFISPYPPPDGLAKCSQPTNLGQALRLFIARFLLRVGYKLLLNNGRVQITTSSASFTQDFRWPKFIYRPLDKESL